MSRQTLGVPAWMRNHGVTEIRYHADTGGNDYYSAQCRRHFNIGGYSGTAEDAEAWRCPDCVREADEFEKATRDD